MDDMDLDLDYDAILGEALEADETETYGLLDDGEALASAGFGTDEDYGSFDGDDWY